jgi:hypothetical protein
MNLLAELRSCALIGAGLACPALAQSLAPSSTVWQCGQLFTNQPQPGQACEPLSSVPSTVVPGTRVNAAVSASAPTSRDVSPPSAMTGTGRASMAAQQNARVLLQAELREQTQRLEQLLSQWNQGRPVPLPQQPEGSPRYQERVATLRDQVQRTEADLAALRRELARLP